MNMMLIALAAAIGIVAVSLVNRESRWNRTCGSAAIILGCLLAILLYEKTTGSPDMAAIIVTAGLVSLLLVFVAVLMSLLCGRQPKAKPEPAQPRLEEHLPEQIVAQTQDGQEEGRTPEQAQIAAQTQIELEKKQPEERKETYDPKQAEMDVLAELVDGRAYRAALRQAFHILSGGYALLPEEKERLKAVLNMLKEKINEETM